MRRYVASSSDELVDQVELSDYEFAFHPEFVRCALCHDLMDAHDDFEDWPYGLPHFQGTFSKIAEDMVAGGLIDAGNPHMTLCDHICERQRSIHICAGCGWWVAADRAVLPAVGSQFWLINLVATATLVEFAPDDLSAPIAEVRNYLRRCYEMRYSLHPRLYEQTVASVFRDIGYRAETTAYSNDGGIDVVLRNPDGERIGVQVKRWRRLVDVEQIRSFYGALMLGGFSRGIFVSTSNFQRGVARTAAATGKMCMPIELVNPDRFFDMLGIAQQNCGENPQSCGFFDTANPPSFLHSAYHLSSL